MGPEQSLADLHKRLCRVVFKIATMLALRKMSRVVLEQQARELEQMAADIRSRLLRQDAVD